ncbi:MAG: DUF1800 family protein, partial [Acidobacteria bacterium]|nr:DUF1800 family protein [Acidobacteriota bacterium]
MRKSIFAFRFNDFTKTVRHVDGAWVGFVAALLLVPVALAVVPVSATSVTEDKAPKLSKAFKGKLPISDLSEEEATLHALNRLGFGPRPGDVDNVRKSGLEKWVDQQLNPEKIGDGAVSEKLERYPTLAMSPAQLMEKYPQPAQLARQAGMSPEEFRKQQEDRQKQREAQQKMREQMTDDEKAMSPDEIRERRRNGLLNGDPNMPQRAEDIRNPQRIVAELSMAKLTRAIYSERQ